MKVFNFLLTCAGNFFIDWGNTGANQGKQMAGGGSGCGVSITNFIFQGR